MTSSRISIAPIRSVKSLTELANLPAGERLLCKVEPEEHSAAYVIFSNTPDKMELIVQKLYPQNGNPGVIESLTIDLANPPTGKDRTARISRVPARVTETKNYSEGSDNYLIREQTWKEAIGVR